eukprot:404522-Rhodomonas_salina.1
MTRTPTSCTASYFPCMELERQLEHYTTPLSAGSVRMGLSRQVSRNQFGFATPTTATHLGSSSVPTSMTCFAHAMTWQCWRHSKQTSSHGSMAPTREQSTSTWDA